MTDTITLTELRPWDPEWLVRRGLYMTEITPALAQELLKLNTNNRHPKPQSIAQFKRDMEAKHWDADASDIKISRTGELIDGQNRLMACVEAGVPFPTLVRTGLSLDTKQHVDTGSKRTAGDVLKMNGITGATSAVGAAIALRARYSERVELFDRKRGLAYRSSTLTHDELLGYLGEHPMILKFQTSAEAMRRVVPTIPGSVLLAALSWFAEKDELAALDFSDRLLNAEFRGQGDPLSALLVYATQAKARRQGSPGANGRVVQEAHMIAMIRVWNAMRSGTKLDRLRVSVADRLPVPK